MAKQKPASRPKRRSKNKQSASARPATRPQKDHGPPRPAPVAEVPPLDFLFSLKSVETLLRGFLDFFSVPRTLGITVVLLVFLLPLAFWLRREDINKNMGARYFSNQQWELALESYENSAPEDQDNLLAAISMARCYLEAGEVQKAAGRIEVAREGLKIDRSRRKSEYTNNINALSGWILLETGQTNEALSTLNRLLVADENHPLGNYLLARHMLKIGNLNAASTYFQKLSKYPEYADFLKEYEKALNEKMAQIPESEWVDLPQPSTSTLSQTP